MNVEISNVCSERLKEVVVRKQCDNCTRELNITPEALILQRSGDNNILVRDIDNPAGVLISKLDLATMLPDELDLRPFKNNPSQQLTAEWPQTSLEAFVSHFNKDLHCELVGIEHDVLVRPTRYSKELLKEFILFCRVYGFWQLDSMDFDMNMDGEYLYLTVVATHERYTGHIKVRI